MFTLIVLLAGFGLSFWVCGYAIGHPAGREHNIELDHPREIVILSLFTAVILGTGVLIVAPRTH